MKAIFNDILRNNVGLIALVGWLFFGPYIASVAQPAIPITLEKVLQLGGAGNLTIAEYTERQELAVAALSKEKEWWLPEMYGGFQAHQLWGAVMNGNGRFFLDVTRNSQWLGLGLNAHWDFADGIYSTRAANLQVLASQYLTEAERNKVLLRMIDAYYDMLAAQFQWQAYRDLTAQADTLVGQLTIQVEAGLRYQSEELLAKGNKRHLQMETLTAQTQYSIASAELLGLLNLDQAQKLVVMDSMLFPLDYSDETFPVVDTLYRNRPEVKVAELEIRALEIKRKIFTTGLLIPAVNIGTYGSYFGKLNGNVVPMEPVAFPNPDGLNRTGELNASLMWRIPLGTFAYRGDIKKYNSLIRLKRNETQQVRATINKEIAQAHARLAMGREQVQVASEALALTKEALDQSMGRQLLGTATPFEVFQAQQFYLQAQLDYLQAIAGYNKAQFAMKAAKGERL